jgi:hypothetical protein
MSIARWCYLVCQTGPYAQQFHHYCYLRYSFRQGRFRAPATHTTSRNHLLRHLTSRPHGALNPRPRKGSTLYLYKLCIYPINPRHGLDAEPSAPGGWMAAPSAAPSCTHSAAMAVACTEPVSRALDCIYNRSLPMHSAYFVHAFISSSRIAWHDVALLWGTVRRGAVVMVAGSRGRNARRDKLWTHFIYSLWLLTNWKFTSTSWYKASNFMTWRPVVTLPNKSLADRSQEQQPPYPWTSDEANALLEADS